MFYILTFALLAHFHFQLAEKKTHLKDTYLRQVSGKVLELRVVVAELFPQGLDPNHEHLEVLGTHLEVG